MRKLVEKDSKYLLFWFVFNWWANIYLGRKVYAQRSSIIIIILQGVKFYAFQDSMAYRRRTKTGLANLLVEIQLTEGQDRRNVCQPREIGASVVQNKFSNKF